MLVDMAELRAAGMQVDLGLQVAVEPYLVVAVGQKVSDFNDTNL